MAQGTEEKWRKVWTDLKNNTKRKAVKLNRAMTGTGGGPALKISLTDLELRVLNIMGEQAATGMATIPEVGFAHINQESINQGEVEILQGVECDDPNQVVFPVEVPELLPEPSYHLNRGDEDWNHPSTSQEHPPPPPPTPDQTPARKWTPLAKKTPKKNKQIELGNEFLKAERDRDKMYYELEKERIRQRDCELELQQKWLAFMNEALSVLRKFMEEKSRDG